MDVCSPPARAATDMGGEEDEAMNRYGIPDEPNFDIPKAISFIDDIVLDQELQQIREEFREDWAPIEAAWASYEPGRTYGQLLPALVLEIDPDWQLTSIQAEFLRHLVFQGEIAPLEAIGLVTRPGFRSALEIQRELYGDLPMDSVLASANLMSQLQKEFEAVA